MLCLFCSKLVLKIEKGYFHRFRRMKTHRKEKAFGNIIQFLLCSLDKFQLFSSQNHELTTIVKYWIEQILPKKFLFFGTFSQWFTRVIAQKIEKPKTEFKPKHCKTQFTKSKTFFDHLELNPSVVSRWITTSALDRKDKTRARQRVRRDGRLEGGRCRRRS